LREKNQVGKSQLSQKSVLISPNRVIRVLIAAGFAYILVIRTFACYLTSNLGYTRKNLMTKSW